MIKIIRIQKTFTQNHNTALNITMFANFYYDMKIWRVFSQLSALLIPVCS